MEERAGPTPDRQGRGEEQAERSVAAELHERMADLPPSEALVDWIEDRLIELSQRVID